MDLYPSLTASSMPHNISIATAFASVIIGPPFLFGIIWFERFGSDKKRTLLNMFATKVCWTNILLLVIVRTLEIVRFTMGPLPFGLCCIQV